MNKLFKKVLYFALAIVLVLGLIFAGSSFGARAAASSQASAQSNLANSTSSSTVQSAVAADTAGPGTVTYAEPTGIHWSPQTAFLEKDAVTELHATLPDPAVTTISFDLRDGTAVGVTKAIAASTGDSLKITLSTNTVKLESLNGKALGDAIVVTFHAKADGLIFAYANTNVATLSGPAFTLYNRVNPDLTVSRGSLCYNYAVSDPTATSATLTILENTDVDSATDYTGLTLTATVASNVLTVTQIYGVGLGQYVNVCLEAATDDNPFGVPAPIAPVVVTIP